MSTKAENRRETILNAANQVVATQGAKRLTLETVAEEARVSKGGLLYHFPNKEALIEGMITRMIDRFETVVTIESKASDDPTVWLKAYLSTTFNPNLSQAKESAGVLAAVANNPALLDPLRKRYDVWQQQIEGSDLDPALATLLRLAADGLWFSELLELGSIDNNLRTNILQKMMELLEGE